MSLVKTVPRMDDLNDILLYSRDDVSELPSQRGSEPSTTENVLSRLKSIAHLRMADTEKPPADTISREELVALKELLDKNLLRYRNYDEHSASGRRPNEPYIGQILHNLNGELHQSNGQNNDDNHRYDGSEFVRRQPPNRYQVPVRRKIIRHAVFATPLSGGIGGSSANNRVYGGDGSSRIEWSSPWADYFPILIKDPFQTMMNSISEIIEYGPAADICRHAARDTAGGDDGGEADRMNGVRDVGTRIRPDSPKRSRRNAAVDDEKGVLNHVRPFRPHHAGTTTTTTEQPKVYRWGGGADKPVGEHNGDTGPQIKRLVVRRGGVAIAGPGGIATAGSGGTAIVGPGGSAYSTKDSASGTTSDVQAAAQLPGISVAGYGPHMVQAAPGHFAAYPQPHGGYARNADGGGTAVLSSDGVAYTFPVPSRGLTAAAAAAGEPPHAASATRQISLPDGAKLIATGPIVYYNPERRKRSRKGRKSSSAGPNATKRGPDNSPQSS